MLFELLNSELVTRVLRTHQTIAFRTGEPPVFVFAGILENFKEIACSYFHAEIPKSDLTKLYGLPVHEVKEYSIVLVGRQADIDRVLSDDFLLLQAHIVAYPATCPQCGNAILPIAAVCGEVNWNGICKKCSTVYMVSNGYLFVYDVKTQFFVRVGSKAALSPAVSGQLTVDESECPPYSNQERFGTPYKSATSICADVPSKLPGFVHDSEPASPDSDPPPKTWRQLPPLC